MQPSTSPPPTLIVEQFSTEVSREFPARSERITSVKQNEPALPSTSTFTKTPDPAGIGVPVKLNPNTVDSLNEIINPAASAAPPEALVTVTPVTSNWNPPISSGLLYITSTDPPGGSEHSDKSQT